MADYSDDDEYVIGYQATDAPPPAQRPPQQQQRLGSRPERCYHLAARLEELGNEEQRQERLGETLAADGEGWRLELTQQLMQAGAASRRSDSAAAAAGAPAPVAPAGERPQARKQPPWHAHIACSQPLPPAAVGAAAAVVAPGAVHARAQQGGGGSAARKRGKAHPLYSSPAPARGGHSTPKAQPQRCIGAGSGIGADTNVATATGGHGAAGVPAAGARSSLKDGLRALVGAGGGSTQRQQPPAAQQQHSRRAGRQNGGLMSILGGEQRTSAAAGAAPPGEEICDDDAAQANAHAQDQQQQQGEGQQKQPQGVSAAALRTPEPPARVGAAWETPPPPQHGSAAPPSSTVHAVPGPGSADVDALRTGARSTLRQFIARLPPVGAAPPAEPPRRSYGPGLAGRLQALLDRERAAAAHAQQLQQLHQAPPARAVHVAVLHRAPEAGVIKCECSVEGGGATLLRQALREQQQQQQQQAGANMERERQGRVRAGEDGVAGGEPSFANDNDLSVEFGRVLVVFNAKRTPDLDLHAGCRLELREPWGVLPPAPGSALPVVLAYQAAMAAPAEF